MSTKTIINKTLVLSVFILAGFLLARSIYYNSMVGAICAIVAIIAWGRFLYKLSELQEDL